MSSTFAAGSAFTAKDVQSAARSAATAFAKATRTNATAWAQATASATGKTPNGVSSASSRSFASAFFGNNSQKNVRGLRSVQITGANGSASCGWSQQQKTLYCQPFRMTR
jgi:hypothetical protein